MPRALGTHIPLMFSRRLVWTRGVLRVQIFQVTMLEFGLAQISGSLFGGLAMGRTQPWAEPSHELTAHISKIFWEQGARFRPCSSLLEGWTTLGLKEKRSELELVFPRLKGNLPHLMRRLGAAELSPGQQLLLVKVMVVFTRKKLLADSRKRSPTWAETAEPASEHPNIKINLKRTACKQLVVLSARPDENKGIYFSFCMYFHAYSHKKQLAVAYKY